MFFYIPKMSFSFGGNMLFPVKFDVKFSRIYAHWALAGLRMDRRVVTSPGVVKVSRLASHLRRSARRGPQIPRN